MSGTRSVSNSWSQSAFSKEAATPCRKVMSGTTVQSPLVVMIPNNNNNETLEAAHAEPAVDTSPLNISNGGDYARRPEASASFVSEKQFAPAVAQLFSSVASPVRHSVRDDVAELFAVHRQGIELNNFHRVFETCFRRPFDSRWSDVSSLRQMLESMVDLVECVELGGEVIVRRKFGSDCFQGN